MALFDLDDVRSHNPVAEVAAQYTPLRRVGRFLSGRCPICNRGEAAFAIKSEHEWACAACPDRGDVISLIQKVEGLDFKAAVARLGGAAKLDPEQAKKLQAKRERERTAREKREEQRRETDRKKLYDTLKEKAAAVDGSAVDTYLASRRLKLPPSTGLRFIRALDYWNGDPPQKVYSGPAMVAPFTRRDGKFGGLHCTWLKPDGAGKAEIKEDGEPLPSKKMRGQKSGSHIVVAGADRRPKRLFLAEGIETVLSVFTAIELEGRSLDGVAFWAAGDLGNLAGRAVDSIDHPELKRPNGDPQKVPGRIPDRADPGLAIPDSVEELILLGDGDSEAFFTHCAMARAARRYERDGRRVYVAFAPAGQDFNDTLRAAGAAEVMQIIDGAINTMADKKTGNVESIEAARKAKKKEPKAAPAPVSDDDEERLEEMNEKWAVTRIGGKTRVMVLEPHEIYQECLVPEFMTLADHKAFFHRRQYRRMPSGQMRWVGEAEWWQLQNDRQQYSKVVFYPEHNVPGTFNLWRGFGIQPSAAASCDRYIEHLHEVICDGDENNAEYLMNWMAWKLQNPHLPPGVAVVLRGEQGAGKGEFVHGYGRLFGPYYRHVTNAKHLVGNFNAHLLATALLFADEAFFAADRSHDGILKALITEPHLSIEKKGYDLLDAARNCLGVFMASNNKWVIPADHDARRYFMLIVSDRRKGDAAYFAKIRDEMANGGAAALMHRLLQRNLTGFDIRDRPLTEALRQQQRYSIRGTDALIQHLCREGVLLDVHDRHANIAITTGESERKGFYVSARRVVPDLGRMLSQTIAEELCREWGCKPWKSNSVRGLEFLALSELRQRFEAKYGPQDWMPCGAWSLAGEIRAVTAKGESDEGF